MDARFGKVGEILNVEIDKDIWCVSKIQQVEGDMLYISMLTHYNVLRRLYKDQKIYIIIKRPNGYVGFKGKFLKNVRVNDVPLSVIVPVSQIEWNQRREAFRAKLSLEVLITVFSKYNLNIPSHLIKATSVDISETGISVISKENLEFNSFIECEFEMGGVDLTRRGRVIRSIKYENIPGMYFTAVAFLDHNESMLKPIRKYIFDLQKNSHN